MILTNKKPLYTHHGPIKARDKVITDQSESLIKSLWTNQSSPISDGLMTNAPAVTGAHGHAPDAHVVHDGVGRHGPVVSEGPLVVVQVESSCSKLDRSVFPESEVSMIFPVLVWL